MGRVQPDDYKNFIAYMLGVDLYGKGREARRREYAFFYDMLRHMDLRHHYAVRLHYSTGEYWKEATMPTLRQVRAQCSGIFLEKVGDSSVKTLGEVLENSSGEGCC